MQICFFIGHRDAPENLYGQILAEAENCIRVYGDMEFIVGRYGHFDTMAARAVITLKEKYPGIRLIQLVPDLPPKPLLPGFDGSVYPLGAERVPKRAAIIRANQYIAKKSSVLIAYAVYPASNAWNLVESIQHRINSGELICIRLSQAYNHCRIDNPEVNY